MARSGTVATSDSYRRSIWARRIFIVGVSMPFSSVQDSLLTRMWETRSWDSNVALT